MSLFLPRGEYNLAKGIKHNGKLGSIVRLNFDYFLDRQDVINRIGAARAKSLRKVGYKVMQTARRSITRMGQAKPKLKIMRDNPGVPLSQLARREDVSKRTQRRLQERLFEIRTRPPSPAGTPPHTHTGVLRNNIVFAWDPTSESVVIGSFMRGGAWLASLHEFGGSQRMRAWAFSPPYARHMKYGILAWYRVGRQPRVTGKGNWEPTQMVRTWKYPKRPYMLPAGLKAMDKLPWEFRNAWRLGGYR